MLLAAFACGYLLLLLVSELPWIQTRLAEAFSSSLKEKFGTEVRIGKVQLGLFNSLILDSVTIKDHEGRTIIGAERMMAKVQLRSFAISPITIRTIELYRANINLVKPDAGKQYNFQFILDSLSSKDKQKQSALNLKIKSIILSRCDIKHDLPYTPSASTFDVNHLSLHNLDASIGIKVSDGNDFRIRLRNIAFQEKSGLVVKSCYANAAIGKNIISIPIFKLETPTGRMLAKNIRLSKDLQGKFSGEAELKKLAISTKDIRPFVKKEMPEFAFMADANVRMRQNRLVIPDLNVRETGGNALMRAYISYDNPSHFYVKVKELEIKQPFTKKLSATFHLKDNISEILDNTGDLDLTAEILRSSRIIANAKFITAVGSGNLVVNTSDNNALHAKLVSRDLNVGKLLGKEDLLGCADVNSEIGVRNGNEIDSRTNLHSFVFKKYTYHNIVAEAKLRENVIDFKVNSHDHNADFNLKGRVDTHEKSSQGYKIETLVNKFNPHALNLFTRYPNTSFSAKVNADIKGGNLTDAIGKIEVADLTTTDADTVVRYGDVAVFSRIVNNGKRISLSGNVGEGQLTGRFNFDVLARNFLHIINAQNEGEYRKSADNVFDFNLHLKDASLINFLAKTDLGLANGAYASGYIDSREGVFQIESEIPSLYNSGNRYSDMTLYMKGNLQNTKMHLHVSKQLEKGIVEIESNAENNGGELNNTVLWKSSAEHRNSGEIRHIVKFDSAKPGYIETEIKPSSFVLDDTVWNVSAAKIAYDKSRILIDNLSLRHAGSGMTLNGVASKLSSDSLQANLHNVRIQNVLDFVAFDDVQFDGNANGVVNVANVLGAPHVNASLKVDGFVFNHAAMGDMVLNSYWNNESKKIEIAAMIRDGFNSTGVNGFVNPAESDIDLRFRANRTNAMFLNDFFPDAMQLLQGRTSGNLRLFGNLHAMNLEGRQIVSGLQMNVDPLGTKYNIDGDTVYFSPDNISFPSFKLHDAYGNIAMMSGKVRHRALHDFSYDMELEPRNFLAYDQSQTDESSSFWGTAFVDGHIRLYGGSGFFTTDANVTPCKKTLFVYNADQPESADNVELLRFRNADGNNAVKDSTAVKPEGSQSDVGTDIRLNFNINVTPDAELRVIMDDKTGNMISAHGHGNVSAHFYNKGSFDMYGIYNVEDGTYKMKFQDLIQKNFTLRNGGRIAFNGNPLACALNLQAAYNIPAVSLAGISMQGSLRDSSVPVDCIMNITGSALQPFVNFDIDLPSVSSDQKQMVRSLIATPEDMNMQAMYLLSVGRFYTYNYDLENSAQAPSQASLAMNSFLSSTLSSNINSLLQNFGENADNWSFGTNLATGNDGWNDMDVEGMFTGRLFKGRLLIDGNLGYRDRAAYNSNFVGDFTARYLLNPRGTIQLKAYNESNDRYFTKSTMTTQGGGILFRKSFTKIKDLFRKSKKSNTRKTGGKRKVTQSESR